MDLRSRLQALSPRKAETTAIQNPVSSNSLSITDRLSRLTTHARNVAVVDENEIAHQLNGVRLADGVIRIDQSYPLDSHHGVCKLAQLRAAPLDFLGIDKKINHEQLVFIDTETSGLAGGTGTIAFLLGMARVEGDVLHTRQWLLLAFRGEHAMLQDALAWLNKGTCLVSFNGKTFDIPLLTGRYRQNRMPDPFKGLSHLDLMHPTRRAFSGVWEDCRLQTAERNLLQFNRVDDLPGALMPEIWSRFLRYKQIDALPGVLEHNHLDVLTLPALAALLAAFYAEPSNDRCNLLGIAERHIAGGRQSYALQLLTTRESSLGENGLLTLARLHRQAGNTDKAVHVWEQLAAKGSSMAAERLAKYHEHATRDYTSALRYADQMASQGINKSQHRLKRLQNKIQRQGEELI